MPVYGRIIQLQKMVEVVSILESKQRRSMAAGVLIKRIRGAATIDGGRCSNQIDKSGQTANDGGVESGAPLAWLQ